MAKPHLENYEISDFIKSMPKIELHAHLNGSIPRESLLDLAKSQCDDGFIDGLEYAILIDDIDKPFTDLKTCFKKFGIAHQLTENRNGLAKATLSVLESFKNDNVIYLELRTTLKSTHFLTRLEYLECVLNVIRDYNKRHDKLIVKLLPSINRSESVGTARASFEAVEKCYRNNKDIIKGIDFCGNPYSGKFHEYASILEKARQMGLKLALHCGEMDNPEEVKTMIDFGMDRCGHGTFIKDENLDLLQKKNIPVECCLSSNVLCKTTSSYSSHHFKKLFQLNHPTVICTDDQGIFETSLSKEIQIAKTNFDLQTSELELLQLNAVNASFADDYEKIPLRKTITEYFKNTDI